MTTLVRIEAAIEVPPAARPHGFVYVHGVQLEESLAVGACVEFADEGGEKHTARVVDETRDRLGPRYRLQLLPG